MKSFQLVGVPGSGKSFYLNLLKKNPINNIDYFDFKDLFNDYSINFPKYNNKMLCLKILDDLFTQNRNILFDSHFVFFQEGIFENSYYFHKYAKSSGYIFIDSNSELIADRILNDVLLGKRKSFHFIDYSINKNYIEKKEDLIFLIERYKETSLEFLKKITFELNIDYITINNNEKNNNISKNINQINDFLNNHLK
ncbi:MAG: hypothetical protein WC393_00025 [Candidatus Nanoarchaeia archaeon]|jgi:hypothetical protein